MRARDMLICLAVVGLFSQAAGAEGMIQKLPEDGTWVKYHLNWQLLGPGAVDSEGTGTWTMRSVGTEMVEGMKCRWIEVTEQIDPSPGEPDEYVRTYKFLIREKAFQLGEDPWKHVIRFWWKQGEDDARKVEGPPTSGWVSTFLQGPPDTSKDVKLPKTVPYQRGDFQFEKARWEKEEHRWQQNGRQRSMTFERTLWLNEKVPFGTAASRIESKSFYEDKYHWTWIRECSLSDFGTGAKTALPEAD